MSIALLLGYPDTTLCRTRYVISEDTANVAYNGYHLSRYLWDSQKGVPALTLPVIVLGNHKGSSWIISRLAFTYLRSMLTLTDISLAQSRMDLLRSNEHTSPNPGLFCALFDHIAPACQDHGLSNSLTISLHTHSLGFRRLRWQVYGRGFPIQVLVPLRALFKP